MSDARPAEQIAADLIEQALDGTGLEASPRFTEDEKRPFNWSDRRYAGGGAALYGVLNLGVSPSLFDIALSADEVDAGLPGHGTAAEHVMEHRGLMPWMARGLEQASALGAPVEVDTQLAGRLFWDAPCNGALTELALRLDALARGDFTHLILTPWMATGGAELVAIWHARAAAAGGGRALVIGTDAHRVGWADRLPEGTIYLSLPEIMGQLEDRGWLSVVDQASAIFHLACSKRVSICHVINSYVGHHMLYLDAVRPFKSVVSIFSYGLDEHKLDIGYAPLARRLKGVDSVLTDNMWIASLLSSKFGIDPSIIDVIDYPTVVSEYEPIMPDEGNTNVLWASRLDDEKLPHLIFEIAARRPAMQFYVYGSSLLNEWTPPLELGNVHMMGAFNDWHEVLARPYGALLFTSKWEGMPNIILQACASRLAIVASNVGGISEVLAEDRGWLVDEILNPEAYAECLDQALINKGEGHRRAMRAYEHICTHRSVEGFIDQMVAVGYIQLG